MNVVNLAEKFSRFDDYWNPRIAGELNDCYVKLAKLRGEFIWHSHAQEDELFLVVSGKLHMKLRTAEGEREMVIAPGEFLIVPRGTEHLPVADEEVQVLLLEPKTTVNTGEEQSERTRAQLDWT